MSKVSDNVIERVAKAARLPCWKRDELCTFCRNSARAIIEEVADAIDRAFERGERVAGWTANNPNEKTHAATWLRAQAQGGWDGSD